jgi:chromosome segregation ATPase
VCFKENCRKELLQFLEENYHGNRVASGIDQELRANITGIKEKQTVHETSIQNHETQIETNRKTSEELRADIEEIKEKQTGHKTNIQNQIDKNMEMSEKRQNDSTKTLTNYIYYLVQEAKQQQQKSIETLNLQNNAAVRADIAEIKKKLTIHETHIKNKINQIETNRIASEKIQDDSTRILRNNINYLVQEANNKQQTINTLKNDLVNKQNQIDTNKITSERKQDESTKTLTNRINDLVEQDRQQNKTIETLKNDLQKNTAFIKVLLNETSANHETTIRSIEDTPIPTWAIIMLVIWNITLTIICAYYCYSFSKQQSPNQNTTSMESPVCINPIYATAADMTNYSSTQENRSRQLPTKRWPGSKKVIVNPIYQSSVDQCDDGLYSEI